MACSSGRFNASVGVAVIEETKDFGELTDGLNNTELVAHFIEHVSLERKWREEKIKDSNSLSNFKFSVHAKTGDDYSRAGAQVMIGQEVRLLVNSTSDRFEK